MGGGGGDLCSRLSLRCRRGAKLILAQTNHARLSCRPLFLPAGVELYHDRSLGIAHKPCTCGGDEDGNHSAGKWRVMRWTLDSGLSEQCQVTVS